MAEARLVGEESPAAQTPLTTIRSVDHIVLTCANVDATAKWYSRLLGMRIEKFGSAGDRTALKFGSQKLNLHQRGAECEPKAAVALPGTVDICLVVDDETDLRNLAAKFREQGVQVLENNQVVSRTGARGPIRSIYVRDPDANLVE